ncbi:MAG: ABC transporter permease, partial [Clostridia bacterium]|nr:ABC transporter permease [Clostridia bacterium]
KYADRIIELFDGRVVSDREFVREETAFEAAGLAYGEGEIRIPSGYRLTEEDRERINAYLAALEEGDDTVIRRAETARRQSRETVTPDLSRLSPIRFIKSRLPVKAAFRIGCGALKHKKIRLAFTIILSLIAFVLFGLADTFGAYDHVSTCARSIQDSAIHYVSLVRSEKIVRDEEEDDYYYRRAGGLSQDELEDIGVEYGVPVRGVFTPYRADLGFGNLFDRSSAKIDSYYGIYADRFNGFAAIDEETLREENLSLVCGRLPQGGKAEIAISTYVCETFERAGFARREGENTVYDPVTGPEDMLGKIFPLGGTDYTVVGVVSSGFNLERYRKLTELSEDETYAEIIVAFALRQELAGIQEYSLCQVALVGEERLEEMIRVEPKFENMVNGNLYLFENRPEDAELDEKQMIFGVWYGYPDSIGTLADQGLYEIEWVNGKKTELKGGEVVISADLLNNLLAFWSDVPEGFRDADLSKLTENEWTELKSWLSGLSSLQVNYYSWIADAYESEEPLDATVVGILMPDPSGKTPDPGAVILAADEIVLPIISDHRDGVYDFAVGAMPKEYDKVERIVGLSLREDTDVRFELQNPVTYELDVISGVLAELSRVFVVIGVFFAAFAAILLANFIGTSIAYKKQEIGILRAIGARSNDVFRIFFSESFVIAMTNFLLASAGTALTVFLINRGIRSSTGLLITVLSFTARQAALILGVSVLVAAVASFLPVKKIASKKPVDAIRGR